MIIYDERDADIMKKLLRRTVHWDQVFKPYTKGTLHERKGPTKHRTDRTGGEIAAGKAQINCRDLV